MIMSIPSLVRQGIPQSFITSIRMKSSQPMLFECGGGDVPVDDSITVRGDLLGTTEGYLLKEGPIAVSQGDIVGRGYPYVWTTGSLPWHCTDPSKLTIVCPLKYRRYADKVVENVPYFSADLAFGNNQVMQANTHFLAGSVVPCGPSPPAEDLWTNNPCTLLWTMVTLMSSLLVRMFRVVILKTIL